MSTTESCHLAAVLAVVLVRLYQRLHVYTSFATIVLTAAKQAKLISDAQCSTAAIFKVVHLLA